MGMPPRETTSAAKEGVFGGGEADGRDDADLFDAEWISSRFIFAGASARCRDLLARRFLAELCRGVEKEKKRARGVGEVRWRG